MTTTQIFVRIIDGTYHEVPGPIEMGKRFILTEDLALERYDDSTPGNGLPVAQDDRLAGTHSGVVTIIRIAQAGDRFFPVPSFLFQYEVTYKFNALDDTPLQKGQVTAHGLFLVEDLDDWKQLEIPVRFAITGGTGPYSTAHGTITEGVRGTPTEPERFLDIEL
jgi:hypothetical protein